MPTLDPKLRDLLATVIGKENADDGARIIAEAGASAAIEALAVHLPSPYGHLDTAQRQLRNRLRARARQLGDAKHADGGHQIGRLVEQMAYEHWHRMLFARFLAENELLIHPEMKVAVTLEECAELAESEGAEDGWELAGRYASRMLPQIFRPDDALLAVRFAIESVKKLEKLLEGLPAVLFRASDSLGWCYQFWQARKKKQVNASEVKIGADEISAVTQLFTEPYMVHFLLHNTLGAWWVGAGRTLPVEMPYLRFLDDGSPAAGTFDGWPRLARELKVLDPCCGSGHFLVAAFEILVAFRIAEEGLTAREACDAVLRDNLFGLEIDARCVQIAAFAVAMAAWTYPDAGGYRPLAPMNVACSGLAISAKKEEWERLGGENARLRAGMGRMWELFSDAPLLGSLIDPRKDAPNPIQVARFEDLAPMLAKVLEMPGLQDPDELEMKVAARGLADAAETLGCSFTLVITNVPYLSWKGMSADLQLRVEPVTSAGKHDLATAFISRALQQCSRTGTAALVTPQNWTYQDYYKSFRRELLLERRLQVTVWLGAGAFGGISGEVVKPALVILGSQPPATGSAGVGIDVDSLPFEQKQTVLRSGLLTSYTQDVLYRNPDHRITLQSPTTDALLGDHFEYGSGVQTGDFPRFGRKFWEVPMLDGRWVKQQTTVSDTVRFGGMTNALLWEGGFGELNRFVSERLGSGGTAAWLRGAFAWGRSGIAISPTGKLHASLYTGELFDDNTIVLIPKNPEVLIAGWAFCSSEGFNDEVRKIDKALKVRGALASVPFDLPRWSEAARRLYPDGVPKPQSVGHDQWVFSGHPRESSAPLQVSVARLLGYRWPDQQSDELDKHTDDDGIVCITAIRGERPAADRLADLLSAAWGKDWHPQTLTDLLAAVGHSGTVEEWLRDAFFKQHCELFHHRPFIWQIWDGHREGFSALVNYHKLDHEGLKSLTYSYLGDWIRTQELEAKSGKSGAGDKVAKAKALQQRLAAILEGEAPLDIFVRWKPIEQQPIGWHPDLDDGVRLNIRPFMMVQDVAGKGAGVLRWKPNIKWGKDRGKNPPGSPWGEDRDNDVHLTQSAKRAAGRERQTPPPKQPAEVDADDEFPDWKLLALSLENVGPAPHLHLRIASRLTLICGENGLGKSFLLDALWWAIASHWPGRPALPTVTPDGIRRDVVATIQADAAIATGSAHPSMVGMRAKFDIASHEWCREQWQSSNNKPTGLHGPELLGVYFRVDGEAEVYDPITLSHTGGPLRILSYGGDWSSPGRVGVADSNPSDIELDWLRWESERTKEGDTLRLLMVALSDPTNLLVPGKPLDIGAPDGTLSPSLAMRNGDIPIALISAGVRRVLRFAYVLTRAWSDHVKRAATLGRTACKNLLVIADEPELHLHPEWQRILLPALVKALRELDSSIHAQLVIASHSPLILASAEAYFDPAKDRLIHLARGEPSVKVRELDFAKQGDVSNWLISEVFDRVPPRSLESQLAIEAAQAFMRGDYDGANQMVGLLSAPSVEADEADEAAVAGHAAIGAAVHEALARALPGHDEFWVHWTLAYRPGRSIGRRHDATR